MMGIILQIAIFVITIILISLIVVISAARALRTVSDRRYETRINALRPVVLRTLSDDKPDTSTLDAYSGPEAKLVEELAWSMLPKVRGASRQALVQWLVDRGCIDRACRATRSFSAVKRAQAAQHLGAAGVAETEPDVARLLVDRDQEVRIVAARALGKLGNPDAVPSLLSSLEGSRRIPTSLVSMAIIHIGPTAVDQLLIGLNRYSSWSRIVCVELLGIHGAYQATKLLCDIAINDMSAAVRASAATALGRIGSPQAVPTLLEATQTQNQSIQRVAATRALGRIGEVQVFEPLLQLTRDSDAEVAIAATEALSSLGQRGREMLVELANETDDVASRARDWLSRSDLAENRIRRRRAIAR